MEGRIWVESAEGGGSTFHFTAQFEQAKRVTEETNVAEIEGMPLLGISDGSAESAAVRQLQGHGI